MKIVIVSTFYSKGMGYSENCLPKSLVGLGHEVHVVTSNLNIYGNEEGYAKTYSSFLGPADQGTGKFSIDGYFLHRLPSNTFRGYVNINKLYKKIRELSPDIVHTNEIAAFHTFKLAILKPFLNYKLFTESHQHLSVVKPFLKEKRIFSLKKLMYLLTRTLPSSLASIAIEKCYAIAPDCALVANKYYGVPKRKIRVQRLGTDTDLFKPAITEEQVLNREKIREQLGYSAKDIVCIYTGRFSKDKNPLILAKAIDKISNEVLPFHGLFIGEGIQAEEIAKCNNVKVLPFVKHTDLAKYYMISDIAVWPTQESMSMLDAASCGLPLVVSDKIGEYDRIDGNGKVYQEGNSDSLCEVLRTLSSKKVRNKLGYYGREKMEKYYSWNSIAMNTEKDYYQLNSKL
jgi:glycosyltransferase involved in cell wall biosynthesis